VVEEDFFTGGAFGSAGLGTEDLGVYVEAFFIGGEVLGAVE